MFTIRVRYNNVMPLSNITTCINKIYTRRYHYTLNNVMPSVMCAQVVCYMPYTDATGIRRSRSQTNKQTFINNTQWTYNYVHPLSVYLALWVHIFP